MPGRDDAQLAAGGEPLDEAALRRSLPVPPLLGAVAVAERGGVDEVGVLVEVHAGVGGVHRAREPDHRPLHLALQMAAVPDLAARLAAARPGRVALGRDAVEARSRPAPRRCRRARRRCSSARCAAGARAPASPARSSRGRRARSRRRWRSRRRAPRAGRRRPPAPRPAAPPPAAPRSRCSDRHRRRACARRAAARGAPGAGRSPGKRGQHGVEQPVGAEAHRIVHDEPGLVGAAAIAARASSSPAMSLVFSAIAATRAGRTGAHAAS